MLESAIVGYYTFFDKTLSSNTAIVILIAILVCIVGLFHQTEAGSLHADILELSQKNSSLYEQIIEIDGIRYQVSFQKIGN